MTAERKLVRIAVKLDERIGLVSGDSLRLQQVISNLLTNAIKFTPEEGAVNVVLESPGSDVILRVSDTGVGIEPKFLPFVFDRFTQQENSSARQFGGLGLGLSIVRNIVEMHGGKVHAESPGPGKGAVFTVTLPLLPVARQEAPPDERPPDVEIALAAPELSKLRGLRILVVDDDPGTLDASGEMLRLNGASVIAASSAAEALRAVRESTLQLIVSEIAMPGEDGYSLIRSIRAMQGPEAAAVPAIALTAAAGVNGRKQSLEAGFQDHLEKPSTSTGWLARSWPCPGPARARERGCAPVLLRRSVGVLGLLVLPFGPPVV